MRFFCSVSLCICLSTTGVHAATVLIGDAYFSPANGSGDRLYVAGGGSASAYGTAVISAGEKIQLNSGTDANELPARPKVDVGEGGYSGYVLITGVGTVFELNGTNSGSKFEIGDDPGSVGTVEITDGAQVIMRGGASADGDVDQGKNIYIQFGEDGGTGAFTVSGATLTAEGDARVGILAGSNAGSTGDLTLENATMTMETTGLASEGDAVFALVGAGAGTNATASISNSSLELLGDQVDGYFGIGVDGASGEMTLSDGSLVRLAAETAQMEIGSSSGGSGDVVVSGSSSLEVTGESNSGMSIGRGENAFGRLRIEGGSDVNVNSLGTGLVSIGEFSPGSASTSVGILQIDGAGSSFNTSNDIQVGAGVGEGANTTAIVSLNQGVISANQISIGGGGFLVGTGSVVADVAVEAGGTIGPGFSPGTINIDGDLLLNGGALEIEIAGDVDGLFDEIVVSGSVIAGGMFDLIVRFVGGYTPEVGESWAFLKADSGLSEFLQLAKVSVFGGGVTDYDLVLGEGGVSFEVEAVSAIPLPPGALLLMTGFGALALHKRRRAARPLAA